MSESKIKKERPLIQTIGLILLVILALGIWYISIPAFLVWYLWARTKLSKKAKIIITAVPSVIIGGAVIWALTIGVIQGINTPTISLISPKSNTVDVYENKIEIKASVSSYNKLLLSKTETQIEMIGVWDTVQALGISVGILKKSSDQFNKFHNTNFRFITT